ncbi:DNA repair protein RecN [uncultured Desulfobacterium sp.]|uniref:DNA repair protein RecN n=1 Tax=uncultured Desulfobacterium sp. TaxID=201089 RepID=A0A445MT04_9BACT|nr:DNA repair protein RecN [uncultured Desulfobacterium sp.]
MLVQLNISDFAIIKDLEITLRPGLNILSGETGAGKSIIINAVNLILGGRASADLIRSGCKEARLEALFSFPENPLVAGALSEMEIPFEGELLIKRTVSGEGRNKISANGSIVTLQMLSRLSGLLISISGQHENQVLLRPDNHLFLLDDFGGLNDMRAGLTEQFNLYQALKEEIRHLKKQIHEISERQELTRFQIEEIDEACITAGEDEVLTEEKRRLQHAEEMREIVFEGYQGLYERNDSVLAVLAQLTRRMEKGVEIDSSLSPIRDGLRETEITLEDIAYALRDFQNKIRLDPERLEKVEERLEVLNRLKRKYGPGLADVLNTRERLGSMMYDMTEKGARLKQLEQEQDRLAGEIVEQAQALSGLRKKAAGRLEKAIEKELKSLHMQSTRFEVMFEGERQGESEAELIKHMRPEGLDHIEFMISPNVGEELRPLSKIASGGELSRIMLAIKTILAQTASVETIIFDEVDSGISGATAEVVGDKVLALSQYHQIICITHLPQIASKGRVHFLVKKEVTAGRTQAVISELDDDARVQEIGRLLGGKTITGSAIAHAREMLKG